MPSTQKQVVNLVTPAIRHVQDDLHATFHGVSVPTASGAAGVVLRGRTPKFAELVFTLSSVALSLTDATTNGAQGSIQLADMPEGIVRILGASASVTLAIGSGLATAVLFSVGTTAAASDNATLTSTEANIIPSTSCTISASAATFSGKVTATEGAIVVDGSGTAMDIYLNAVATDANTTGGGPFAITATGEVRIQVLLAGDV